MACSTLPALAPPALPDPPVARRPPEDPPGSFNLTGKPCSLTIDLTASTPESRAFGPGARSASGRTSLAVSARNPDAKVAWSSSRPNAVRFEGALIGAPTLLAGEPGLARVSILIAPTALGDGGLADEASTLISVPMFVRIRADAAFADTLDRALGLADLEMDVFGEARRTLDSIYAHVNLRAVWELGFHEALPGQLAEGGFAAGKLIEATLHGGLRSCAYPPSSFMNTEFGGYAEGSGTQRLTTAPVHVCPEIFVRHPDTMAWMVRNRRKLFKSTSDRAVYGSIVGRAIGELLAHEIGHQLLGCETTAEGRSLLCHDFAPKSLMNKAGEREFSERTGVVLKPTQYSGAGRDDFPKPGTYEDRGIAGINRLAPEDQALLDRILPVPPSLAADPPCALASVVDPNY